MQTKINAITFALSWVKHQDYRSILIVTDSLSTLEKVRGSNTHQTHHTTHIRDSQTQKITWIYCPGHSGVVGTKLQTSLQARQQFQITATSLTHNLSSTWSPVMTTPFPPPPLLFNASKTLVFAEAMVPDLNLVARPAAAPIKCYAAQSVFPH